MGDYQRLQTEADAEVPLNPASRSRQDVYYYSKPTSFWHVVAFVFSILFCVSVVVFFIWILPCDLSPCQTSTSSSVSWDKTLYGLELKGRMHLVAGNVIAIFSSARWGRKENSFPQNVGGVIALSGRTGDELYWISLSVVPKFLDCSMSDLISENAKACIIIGSSGYLSAFNPISGIIIWKLTTTDQKDAPLPVDIDVPLVVGDMDSDGHADFAMIARFTKGRHRLAFVSGRTGFIIKEPSLSAECNQVNGLKFGPGRSTLVYTCSNEFGSKPLQYVLANNKAAGRVLVPDDEFSRFVQSNSSSGEHNIIVSNFGDCPKCNASAHITDNRNHSIWSYEIDRAYAMNPLSLRIKHSITGFLFKLWRWHFFQKTKTGMKINSIKERIVMIPFNNDNSPVLNVSSTTDIIQLCEEEFDCQPRITYTTQSALIADLNEDGSQDLISYFVTYKPGVSSWRNDENIAVDGWSLESHIKVIHLETELPKFYNSISSQ